MPLPRLSRLSPHAARNLCACQSPVTSVPVIPSGVFDIRRGALSPPQQPIRAGQGAHLSSRRFSSRITGHRSRVTGRWPLVADSPQPPDFQLLNFQLLNFQLLTLSGVRRLDGLDCDAARTRRSLSRRRAGPFLRPSNLSGWAKGHTRGPLVAGRGSPVAGRRLSPLQCALTQKRTRKPFGICTYKSLDLKSPEMNTYKKYR